MLFSAIYLHIRRNPDVVQSTQTNSTSQSEYSTRSPIIYNCSRKHRVAFTFDDGPHATHTLSIIKTLNRQNITAGFFISGTSIQSFLNTHNNLIVPTFERPRIGYLLLQDYTLLENLLDGHEIYMHGWLHEKITEMQIQTVIDNISTQLLEIGLLKGFKPIYRAPWGIGTAPFHVHKKVLLPQILKQMGIVPVFWDIDTKDYVLNVDEDTLINNTVHLICKKQGGLILMHDNRLTTAFFLDRLIRSIRGSGHKIVSPSEINRNWTNSMSMKKTRKYIEYLRKRTLNVQNNVTFRSNNYRPIEITLSSPKGKIEPLHSIFPLTQYQGTIRVHPNINDV
ncbi:unnamed protein product [Adineta ricciae]|uniref:NodB homology domain-containing protein n=1 Tax=Adineta ricciae TaxID=249248 RepID=A0A815CL48_ADIRI|nr:unnamed protein product [Adineta ricciae]CAF1286634.1 unnamed protein product [Adineta ricciae]